MKSYGFMRTLGGVSALLEQEPTLQAANGMSGNNKPCVVYEANPKKSYLLKIRGGIEVDSQGKRAGKGALIAEDISNTIGAFQDQYLFQPVEDAPQTNEALFFEAYQHHGWRKNDKAGTITAGQNESIRGDTPLVVCFDGANITNPLNQTNPQLGDPCHTLSTDSRNYIVICLEGNGSRPSHFGNGFKESDKMYTLNTTEVHGVCYGVCSYESNSMKSSNPHSGFYEAETARTLDANGGNPTCNQGGMLVVQKKAYCIGNGQVHDAMQIEEEKSKTLSCMHDQNIVLQPVASFYPQMKAESQCFRDDGICNTLVVGTNPGFHNGVVIALDRAAYNQGENAQFDFCVMGGVQHQP